VAYAALVASMGVTGLALVAVQAFAVGHWCALCLLSAAISELVLALSAGRLYASWAFLRERYFALGHSNTVNEGREL
jgi:hypothetical protein